MCRVNKRLCFIMQGTHVIMGGLMIVNKGAKEIQYMFTEDFFGDHPTVERVRVLGVYCACAHTIHISLRLSNACSDHVMRMKGCER